MLFLPPEEIISPSSALLLSTSPFLLIGPITRMKSFWTCPNLCFRIGWEDDHNDHKDRNNDDEGVGGLSIWTSVQHSKLQIEFGGSTAGRRGREYLQLRKNSKTDLATEAAKADVRIELDKNCQRVTAGAHWSLGSGSFPEDAQGHFGLEPFPIILEKMLEML